MTEGRKVILKPAIPTKSFVMPEKFASVQRRSRLTWKMYAFKSLALQCVLAGGAPRHSRPWVSRASLAHASTLEPHGAAGSPFQVDSTLCTDSSPLSDYGSQSGVLISQQLDESLVLL